MGHRNHDYGRLWRHGAKDVRGHVRGRAVRPGGGAHHRPTSPSHRLQFLNVLFAHAGEDKNVASLAVYSKNNCQFHVPKHLRQSMNNIGRPRKANKRSFQ